MTWPPAEPVTASSGPVEPDAGPDRGGALADLVVVLAVMALAGVLAGIAWSQLVDPVIATRTELGVSRPEVELVKQIDADGWFVTLGFGTSLVLGVVLMLWRRRDPVLTLLAVVVLSLLAAWLCAQVGSMLGPDPASDTLAKAAIGDEAPDQVVVSGAAAYLAWPFGAAVGAMLVLLGLGGSDRSGRSSVVQ